MTLSLLHRFDLLIPPPLDEHFFSHSCNGSLPRMGSVQTKQFPLQFVKGNCTSSKCRGLGSHLQSLEQGLSTRVLEHPGLL